MPSYNLGRAVGTIRIVYNSSGVAAAERDVTKLEARLDAITNKAVRINVNDQEAQRRIDVIVGQLDKLSEDVANPEVTLSDDDFRIRFRSIEAMLDQLAHDNADPSVNIHIDPTEFAQLGLLREQMSQLDGDTADVRVRISTALAQAQLAELQGEVNHLDGQTITIKARIDKSLDKTAAFFNGLLGLFGKTLIFGGLVAGVLELVIGAVGVLSPLVAGLVGTTGALLGLIVAAGSGIALLGAAAVVAFKPIVEALGKNGDLSKLSDQQKQVAFGIKALANNFTDLAHSVQPQIYSIATRALSSINSLLPKLQPLLAKTADSVDDLFKRGEAALKGPFTQRWIDFLTRQGPQAVTFFGSFVGKLGATVGNTLIGFEPLFKPLEDRLTSFANNALKASRNLQNSKGFQSFLDFIRQTGPEVTDTLGRILKGFVNLASSIKGSAGALLNFIGDLADAIGKLGSDPRIVGALNKSFGELGGIFKDNGGNLSTLVAEFGIALGDLLHAIAPLVPHVLAFAGAMFKAIDNIVKQPEFPKLVEDIGKALDALGKAVDKLSKSAAIGTILTILDEIFKGVAAIFNSPIGPTTIEILALAAALKKLGLIGIIAPRLNLGGLGGAGAAARGGLLAGLGRLVIPVGITLELIRSADQAKNIITQLKQGHFSEGIQSFLSTDVLNTLTGGISTFIAKGWKDGWVNAIEANPVVGFLNKAFGGGDIKGLTQKAFNDLIPKKDDPAVVAVFTTYGLDAAQKFEQALINEKGDVAQAWADVVSSIPDASTTFFSQGVADKVSFFQGIMDQTGGGGAQAAQSMAGSVLPGLLTPEWFANGQTDAGNFFAGIMGQSPFAEAAGEGLSQAAAVGSVWDGTPEGAAGAMGFWAGINGQQGAVVTAAGSMAETAGTGSFWADAGFKQGSDGATNFWHGINSQKPAVVSATNSMAQTATTGVFWNAFKPGSDGATTFWQGINSQDGNTTAAGANLFRSAGLGLDSNPFGSSWFDKGAGLSSSFADGISSNLNRVFTAAGAIAKAAASQIPGSPAEKGPFSIPNDPESRGRRTALSFAAGILSGAPHVAAAAQTAMFAGSNASLGIINPTTGTNAVTDNRKSISYAPVWQYVGPSPREVAQQTQRDFDWSVGR